MVDQKTELSENFALDIVQLYQYLTTYKREYVMSNQILRSGTSIGANIAEANCAESTDDFIHKLSIAQKEASETKYWLKLLYRAKYIDDNQYPPLRDRCEVLFKIISKIIASCKLSRKHKQTPTNLL